MDKSRPPLAAETEVLRAAYAALNRNDIAGFTAAFDAHIERIEFADSPQAGTYHGLEAVKAHVSKARETWAEGSCQPERFIVAPPHPSDNRIIVITHVRVRLKLARTAIRVTP